MSTATELKLSRAVTAFSLTLLAMDYLRTLGSAAVSTLVQKSGLNLPFSLGPKVTTLDGICSLYDGTKRDDGSPVSIFEYDFSEQSKKNIRPLATNALRKLRITRHPDVLKFMDAVETDANIYIMTERVRPLQSALQTWSSREAQEKEDWLLWGLHRISVALAFVNDPCLSTHGKLCVNSIFISPSGEWKLGGFELFSNSKEDSPVLYTLGGLYPGSSAWASPEVKKGGWSVLKEYDPTVADAYALGLLLHSVFNPSLPPPATSHPPHPPPQPSSRGSIPASLFPSFKKLLNPNPKGRLTVKAFLDVGMSETGFFATNRLVKVCLGLDNFALGSEAEKNAFLRTLKESATSFPPEFTSDRVLPSLVSALEFGGASAANILPLVLQFGTNVSPEQYPTVVLAPLIKLFASPDRGTRMALLDHLSEYADRLDKKTVSEKIFPHLATGFSDTIAVIREATTKSIILLAPKLNDRILNNDLLRFLAKMQTDPEASIRTNTCILIGRLGPTLGYHTKKKVLVPAFSRALKDPFVHARVAGLMAFMATIDCFEAEDIATKVIPNIAYSMIDKEKLVRDQAFKAVDLFIKRLESHAITMPETALTDVSDGRVTLPEQATLVNSAAGAAGALAGWAISSLGKKLMTSDLQTSIGGGEGTTGRPSSAPPPAVSLALGGHNPTSPSILSAPKTMSAAATPVASPTLQSTSRAKGMQLGANKVPSNIAAAVLAEQWAEEVAESVGSENPWGNDDLIDVNADADDWSAFEGAPSVILEPKPLAPSSNGSGLHGHAHMSGNTALHGSFRLNAPSNPSSRVSTPIPSSPPPNAGGWDTVSKTPSPAPVGHTISPGMSKEEKAAEMARRKEERKQRIALLKEQKKNTART
ncbi:N-terminal kinase-like protein [Hypsizygus marmoreus]|uniref:N-terminal kinase-like protein n=1 Tax=Hypsizygus marmoreus TaxID=39966 RepID=A0A369JSU4_HYPMA|nr:N-terminal kinase-like protein [Hypsizygus marmoreus]